MRNAFKSELNSIALKDDRIMLLSGDIGNRMFDEYKINFPNRFLNCGVAEANMMSMAAGMAMCGLVPITYTITPFTTIRCLEQIKIDVCYHNVPVIIVGVGSGLSYGELGVTHHSCDDIAFLRVLPNMTVLCPGDSFEVKLALRKAVELNGPVYIRLGKKGEPLVYKEEPQFQIGKGNILSAGEDVCLLSTGTVLPLVVKAGDELNSKGISTAVISFHTVKPLDKELLQEVFCKFKIVVTVEEHSLLGGFGSAIAEYVVTQENNTANLISIGISDEFYYDARNHDQACESYGLTSSNIVKRVENMIKNRKEK